MEHSTDDGAGPAASDAPAAATWVSAAPTGPTSADSSAGTAGGELSDELIVLGQLEEDLAAVDVAIAHLESIASDADNVDDAAQRIAAAVPPQRFVVEGTIHDDHTDTF